MLARAIKTPASVLAGPRTMYQALRHWAERTPAASAIAAPGRVPLTYGALLDVVDGIGATLNASGIGQGDRVAIVHTGGPELTGTIMGVSCYATAIPLNPKLTLGEVAICLRDARVDAVAVAYGADNTARAAAERMGLPVLDIVSDPMRAAGTVSIRSPLIGTPRRPGPPDADDLTVVLATSGTTSSSKLVPLRHRHISARSTDAARRFGVTQADKVLNMMPLFHIGGFGAGLHYMLFSGASVIQMAGLDVSKFFDCLSELRPTFLMGGYTIYHAIRDQADRFAEVIAATAPDIRVIRSGSGRLDPKVAHQLEAMFNAPVIQAYGSSETSFMASEPLPPGRRKEGSVGLAERAEVAIVDPDGALLDVGQKGEVVVRGPQVTDGYENDPVANASAFKGGWYHTGDEGYFDADGYLFLTGRLKEIINRGGEKLAPNEVDDALSAHPAVRQAATFPVPHPTLGEEIAAAVVLEPGATATAAALSAHLRERLAAFKVPRRIVFADAIPTGPTGKIQRHALAAAFGLDGAAPAQEIGRGATTDDCKPTARESKLAALWAEALDLDQVGLDDDFFLLGGDSLQAVELFLRIEETFGQRLPRSVLFDAGTVREMARRIEMAVPSSCIVPIRTVGDRPPFFCVHDQNGHVLNFRDLARHLGPGQPFYGIQCLGLDGREMPFTRMEDMAAHYVQQIRKIQPAGPYYIGGYSFGGRVAYVMAQQLRAEGEIVGLLALLDTYCVTGPTMAGVGRWLACHRARVAALRPRQVPGYLFQRVRLAKDAFKISLRSRVVPRLWRACENMGRPVPRFLRQPALANDIIRREYHPQPYDGDAVLLQAQLPASKDAQVHEGWRKLVRGGVEIRPVPGQHDTFLEEPHVATVAAELADCLSKRQVRNAAAA